jgi:hypothetical protein
MTEPKNVPYLRVVHGDASPEDVAALVAVLTARATSAQPVAPRPPRRSAWSERSRLVRRPLSPGPGAWRASALPG